MTSAQQIGRRSNRQKAARMVEADKSLAFAKDVWTFTTEGEGARDCVGASYEAVLDAWQAAVKAWQQVEQDSLARYVLR